LRAPPEAWCLLTSRIRGRFEILINSAGVMYYTLMKNVRMEEWERTREEPLKTVRLANHGNRHLGAAICLVCNTAKGRQGEYFPHTHLTGHRWFPAR
jgi:hypothetical protein